MSGAFDSFPTHRKQMLTNYDLILNAVADRERGNLEGQLDLFGFSNGDSYASAAVIEIPPAEEYSFSELLEMEKDTIGIYVSGHPLNEYTPWLTSNSMTTVRRIFENSKELAKGFRDGDTVSIIGLFRNKKMLTTKQNRQMCFADVEDVSGNIEVVVFPNVYDKAKILLIPNERIAISGKISVKDEEDPKILADSIERVKPFVEGLKKRTLCVRLRSSDKDGIEKIKELSARYNGDGKLTVWLDDLKKLTAVKGASQIEICNESLSELISIFGADNVKFK